MAKKLTLGKNKAPTKNSQEDNFLLEQANRDGLMSQKAKAPLKNFMIARLPQEHIAAFEDFKSKNKITSREALSLLLIQAGYEVPDLRHSNPHRKGVPK